MCDCYHQDERDEVAGVGCLMIILGIIMMVSVLAAIGV